VKQLWAGLPFVLDLIVYIMAFGSLAFDLISRAFQLKTELNACLHLLYMDANHSLSTFPFTCRIDTNTSI
jgi:hypothetical protein